MVCVQELLAHVGLELAMTEADAAAASTTADQKLAAMEAAHAALQARAFINTRRKPLHAL